MNSSRRDIPAEFDALASGRHDNPYSVLGPQREAGGRRVVRTFQPQAARVDLVGADGKPMAVMDRVHAGGIFVAEMPARKRRYRLGITMDDGHSYQAEDAYRFGPSLGDVDRYLLGEGSHRGIHEVLGAHCITLEGVEGVRFAVWAPNAKRVSVVGDFNGWDGRRHVMRRHDGGGVWELFAPGMAAGDRYKYEILGRNGRILPLKSDPFAQAFEPPPGNASVVYRSDYQWGDADWMANRRPTPHREAPVSIYEVHLGSWRRNPDQDYRSLSYRELASELVEYVCDMGFTHIELLPVTEHPYDGSWGYQPIGLYAPTHRFGSPDEFRFLVDRCHQAGIGVILDWVPAHFPKDEHGLARFDGTALYEHADPRQGEHRDWGTLIFNYGRREVVNYLVGNAHFWIDEFHIDSLRVDAVASMLYLDYSREDGDWIPNRHGGNQNLEAVEFLQRVNAEVHAKGATTCAEESTAWPGVSHPTDSGGLGFSFKWNMGWMNDTLSYMNEEPVHRKHHHNRMTFSLVYAFTENFILPLSHDEVVHGKRSLLGRMPGDEWQRFANFRAYLSYMYGHPGKKLLFMGGELGQYEEWNHDASIPWHLLRYDYHRGVQALVRDLNRLHREIPALHQRDSDPGGFRWLSCDDADTSTLSWLRYDHAGNCVIVAVNLTPVPRPGYRLGVPTAGRYRELFNSNSAAYGGNAEGNTGTIVAADEPWHGQPASVTITLPALAGLFLQTVD